MARRFEWAVQQHLVAGRSQDLHLTSRPTMLAPSILLGSHVLPPVAALRPSAAHAPSSSWLTPPSAATFFTAVVMSGSVEMLATVVVREATSSGEESMDT